MGLRRKWVARCTVLSWAFALLLGIQAVPSQGDMGSPNVQAVCRVTLKSGDTVDGILQLAEGGYERYLRQHGILLAVEDAHNHYEWFIPFDLNLARVLPHRGDWESYEDDQLGDLGSSGPGGHGYGLERMKKVTVYFLREVRGQEGPTTQNTWTEGKDGSLQFRSDIASHHRFEALTYLPLFETVPEEVDVGLTETKPRKLPLDQIETIEFLRDPGPGWLKAIQRHTSGWDARFGICDDCVLLVDWYHELLRPNPEGGGLTHAVRDVLGKTWSRSFSLDSTTPKNGK